MSISNHLTLLPTISCTSMGMLETRVPASLTVSHQCATMMTTCMICTGLFVNWDTAYEATLSYRMQHCVPSFRTDLQRSLLTKVLLSILGSLHESNLVTLIRGGGWSSLGLCRLTSAGPSLSLWTISQYVGVTGRGWSWRGKLATQHYLPQPECSQRQPQSTSLIQWVWRQH